MTWLCDLSGGIPCFKMCVCDISYRHAHMPAVELSWNFALTLSFWWGGPVCPASPSTPPQKSLLSQLKRKRRLATSGRRKRLFCSLRIPPFVTITSIWAGWPERVRSASHISSYSSDTHVEVPPSWTLILKYDIFWSNLIVDRIDGWPINQFPSRDQ